MCELRVILASVVCHLTTDVQPATVYVPPGATHSSYSAHFGSFESTASATAPNIERPRFVWMPGVHGAQAGAGLALSEKLITRGRKVDIVPVGWRRAGGGPPPVRPARGRLLGTWRRAGAGRWVGTRALLPRVKALPDGGVSQRRGRLARQLIALGRQHRQRRAA